MSHSEPDNEAALPDIAVTVDAVVFTKRQGEDLVVLIERGNPPFQGRWALPGGFVEIDEDLPVAASRELREETGLDVPASALTQLGAYGAPGRDPRMRVVSVVFWTLHLELLDPVGGSDAAASRLVPVTTALGDGFEFAFDHSEILSDAVKAARDSGLQFGALR